MRLNRLKLNPSRLLLVTIAILVLIAWNNRFTFDDAFISFRYSEHLAQGHGLVWNIGEAPIEGYTNFLWTLLMSVAFILSIDPELFSWIISIGCFVGSLLGTYYLAKGITNNPYWGVIAVILLGTNFTFNAFATSGLETQCQTMLLILSIYCVYCTHTSKVPSHTLLLITSLLFALALMTRLDSVVMVGILGLACLRYISKSPTDTRQKLMSIMAISLPSIILVGGWLLWKLSFYGDILPNTFYVKADTKFLAAVLKRGSIYIVVFWLSYWLLPFILLIVYRVFRRTIHPFEIVLFIMLLLWTVYLFYVGGDFMEFRFMVAILPLLMVQIVATIAQYSNRKYLQVGLLLIILGGSASHALTFHDSPLRVRMHSIQGMQNTQIYSFSDWDGIGQVLGEAFNYDRSITLAMTPAGLIPYYSKARAIDMLGLNDAWIARNGVPHLIQAGHERITTFAYLKESPPLLICWNKMSICL